MPRKKIKSPDKNKEIRKKFGFKEIISLLSALIITLAIVRFYTPLTEYELNIYIGVCVVSHLANATVVLTAPVLIIVFAAGARLPQKLLVCLLAGIGATAGEVTSYLAFYSGHNVLE